MRTKRLLGVTLLAALLGVGVWLFVARSGPAPEAAGRKDALLQALAPAGVGNSSSSAPLMNVNRGVVYPTSVSTDNLVPYDITNNMYDRWLAGEIDLDENESIAGAAAEQALVAQSLNMAPGRNINIVGEDSDLRAPSIITGFNAVDIDAFASGASVPPDPEMAAGLNHVIAAVNVHMGFYDKNGTELLVFAAESLFGVVPECTGLFDPNIIYDEEADRFIAGYDADGDYYCLAVTDDGDPGGTWYVYAFDVDVASRADFFDYPHAAVGDEAIFMGANVFLDAGGLDARVYAFDKAAMYANGATSWLSATIPGDYDTPQPLNLHGFAQGTWPALSAHPILLDNFDGSTFDIWEFADPWGTPSLSLAGSIDLNAATGNSAGFPVDSPHSGGTVPLANNDWRPQDFEYRNGYGWMVYHIGCNPGAGTVNCIRWAQIDLGSYTVVQAGDFGSDGEYRIFGDLAVNHCGDMAVGYTRTNGSMFPSIYITGREAGDPAGTVQAEVLVKAGEATYASFDGGAGSYRWGDYTGMTIDPDGLTFWYLNEFPSASTTNAFTNWATYIASSRFAACEVVPDFAISSDPINVAACVGTDPIYLVDLDSLVGFTDPVTLSASSLPAGVTAGFSPNPVNPPATATMTLDTAGGSAGSYSIDIVGVAGSLVHTATVGLDLEAAAPAAPALVSPADGAAQQSIKPILTWSGSATSFDVEVATDAAFANIVDSATVMGTSYQVATTLGLGSTYYWRVTAANACGATPSSAFSFSTFTDGACSPGTFPQIAYLEDFSGGANGWTSAAPVGSDTWALVSSNPSPASGGNAFYGEDLGSPSLQQLTSPAIDLPGGNSQLTLQFQNYQDFENPAGSGGCWDGGILEISTNGGSSWTQLNGELLNDPYDGALSGGTPIAGTPAWCGAPQAWTNGFAALDAYAGQTVQFRMSVASDSNTGADGWYIDDVTIQSCGDQPTDVALTGFGGGAENDFSGIWLLPALLLLAAAAFVGLRRLTVVRQDA